MNSFDLFNIRFYPSQRHFSFEIFKVRLGSERLRFTLMDLLFDGKNRKSKNAEFYFTLLKIKDRSLFEVCWTDWIKHIDILFFRFKHKNSL